MTTEKKSTVSESKSTQPEAETIPAAEAKPLLHGEPLPAADKPAVSPLISGLFITEPDGKVRSATPEETAAYIEALSLQGGKQSF